MANQPSQPVTRENLHKLINDAVGPLQATMERDRWVSQKMQDLPETYRSLMPATTDRNELERKEQMIRSQYRADMRTEVPKHVANGHFVGSEPPQNVLDYREKVSAARAAMDRGDIATASQLLNDAQAQPAAQQAAPDFSKMSAEEKIAYGLRQEGGGMSGTAAGTASGQAGAGANDLTPLQALQRLQMAAMTPEQKIMMGLMQKGGV